MYLSFAISIAVNIHPLTARFCTKGQILHMISGKSQRCTSAAYVYKGVHITAMMIWLIDRLEIKKLFMVCNDFVVQTIHRTRKFPTKETEIAKPYAMINNAMIPESNKAIESWILRPFSGWRYCFHGHFFGN